MHAPRYMAPIVWNPLRRNGRHDLRRCFQKIPACPEPFAIVGDSIERDARMCQHLQVASCTLEGQIRILWSKASAWCEPPREGLDGSRLVLDTGPAKRMRAAS